MIGWHGRGIAHGHARVAARGLLQLQCGVDELGAVVGEALGFGLELGRIGIEFRLRVAIG